MTVEDHHHGERFGTAAEWAAANPVLRAGELGVESDTGRIKVGDGSTQWVSLGYVNATEDYVDAAVADLSGTYLPLAGGTLTGLLTISGAGVHPLLATDAFAVGASGDLYPTGLTTFLVTGSTWPTSATGLAGAGIVTTLRHSSTRMVQEYVRFDGLVRCWRSWTSGAWSTWREVSASERVQTASVATSQTTTSTSFTDLATVGPSVTVVVGPSGKLAVDVGALVSNSTTANAYMDFTLATNNTRSASDVTSLRAFQSPVGASRLTVLTGLNPGTTLVTAKYRVDSGTGTFVHRSITATPL